MRAPAWADAAAFGKHAHGQMNAEQHDAWARAKKHGCVARAEVRAPAWADAAAFGKHAHGQMNADQQNVRQHNN